MSAELAYVVAAWLFLAAGVVFFFFAYRERRDAAALERVARRLAEAAELDYARAAAERKALDGRGR